MQLQLENSSTNKRFITFCIQGIRYCFTGGLAFVADFLAYSLLLNYLHYQLANYSGLLVGLAINYVLSKKWVFQSKAKSNSKELFSFCFFTAIAFALASLGLYIQIDLLGVEEKLAKLIISVIIFVFNFLVRKFVIFRESNI